jgi:hypothetical protein
MKSMKWLGLAMLLAVGVTLLASAPAQAGKGKAFIYALYNTGVEPLATGQYTLTKPRFAYRLPADYERWYDVYSYQVTITCQNLTPGARYWASVQDWWDSPDAYTAGKAFTAKPDGTGAVSFRADIDWYWGDNPTVDRLDSDGPVTVLYAEQ